jgi:nicotinamide-nucleotide amidase
MTGTRVELVTIGDELLLGFTIDTNAAHLARALASIGMHIAQRTTVGDDPTEIGRVVREALDRTGAVITTGGLGPTSDDMTKASVAAIFGREMKIDEVHLAWMRDRWIKRFNREMPPSNVNQAMVPVGAEKLENNHGSAPGIWIEDERERWVAMLPGVPREMRGMLGDTLIPKLTARFAAGTVVRSRTLRTVGIAESLLADHIDSMEGGPLTSVLAYLPGVAGVDLRLTVRDIPAADADTALARDAKRLRERVGEWIYGEDDQDLAAIVLDMLRARHCTVAVAESCSGGLLGGRLTAIPGSSDVVLGGVIAYANNVKQELLGVDEATIRAHGAVSEEVVRQMATGARTKTHANIGLAITGVAGPGGGSPEKPVGTVWVAADIDGSVHTRKLLLWGDRDEIRQRSAQWTMELLRQKLSR